MLINVGISAIFNFGFRLWEMVIMENLDNSGQLANDIELNRERLISLGACYGINDPKVLDASRELDRLILCYYKTVMKK
jgi:hypothetical protein